MRLRPFSTLGWHTLEVVGALEIDRTTHPVIQAWMLDAIEPLDSGRAGGMTENCITSIDHKLGRVTVGSRVGGKRVTLRAQAEKLEEAHSTFKAGEQVTLLQCPSCQKFVPKAELDGAYPYECCLQCYWELPG